MNRASLFELAVLSIPIVGLLLVVFLFVISARLKAMHETMVELLEVTERKP